MSPHNIEVTRELIPPARLTALARFAEAARGGKFRDEVFTALLANDLLALVQHYIVAPPQPRPAPMPAPPWSETSEPPTLEEARQYLQAINPEHDIVIEGDALVAYPIKIGLSAVTGGDGKPL